jgi:hypothetical protein
MTECLVGGIAATSLSIRAAAVVVSAVGRAVRQLLTDLKRGRRIDAARLRSAMEAAIDTSDTTGAGDWKAAYHMCEASTLLFLRWHGTATLAKVMSLAAMLPMLLRLAIVASVLTCRSEESQSIQHFSFLASVAASITPAGVVLETLAITGLLAMLAELAAASRILNEFAESRTGILSQVFPALSRTWHTAAQIRDHLDANILRIVLINPSFPTTVHVDRQMADAPLRNVSSGLERLSETGLLWAITGANDALENSALVNFGDIALTVAIDSAVYTKDDTGINTRLTVVDRDRADDVAVFPAFLHMFVRSDASSVRPLVRAPVERVDEREAV